MATGCKIDTLGTAREDLSPLACVHRSKLLAKLELLAAQSPTWFHRREYHADCGQVFCKVRHGRHRCYLLGHWTKCAFRLHTVVLNKDEHSDPHREQLEHKLSRPLEPSQ